MGTWQWRLFTLASAWLCSGCCVSNCSINDLQFMSLEPRSLADTRLANKQLYPLELQFSTVGNLVDLQDSNDVAGISVRVYVCEHGPDGFANFVDFVSPVYFNGSYVLPTRQYKYNARLHVVNERYDPGFNDDKGPPSLHRDPDGRITYQALIGIRSESIDVQSPDGGRTIVQRPLPQPLPDLCLRLLSSGYFTHLRSNVVHIPADAAGKAAFFSQSIAVPHVWPIPPALLQQTEQSRDSEQPAAK